MKFIKSQSFKLIRVAYSEQYLQKKYPSLNEYHSLILEFVSKFKELPSKESKVKQKKFFDKLSRLDSVNDNILRQLFTNVFNLSFENSEREFNPLVVKNFSDLGEREWVQNLLDNGKSLEEDIPKILSHIKELRSLGDKELSEFSSDGELFSYLQTFKKDISEDYPDKLLDLLSEWKLGEDEVEGHKVELFLLKRVKIDNRDSLQIIGGDSNWCVCTYPDPHKYDPDEYHCFFIDGEPEVLLHKDSAQIKNTKDEAFSDYRVKYIAPLIEKFELDELEGYIDEDDNDFIYFEKGLSNVEKAEELLNNKDLLRFNLENSIRFINYLPLDATWDHLDILYKKYNRVNPDRRGVLFEEISHDVLSNFGNYIQANNLAIPEDLKSDVINVISQEANRYLKLVPSSIRKLFNNFNEGFEILRNTKKDNGRLLDTDFYKTDLFFELLEDNADKWMRHFPESEKKEGSELYSKFYEIVLNSYDEFLEKNPGSWSIVPQEIIGDPKIKRHYKRALNHFSKSLSLAKGGNFIRVWKNIPEDLKSDPEINEHRNRAIDLALSFQPWQWADVPEDLRDSPELSELRELAIKHIFENLDTKNNILKCVTPDLMKNEELKVAVYKKVHELLGKSFGIFSALPMFLKEDPNIFERFLDSACKAVENDPNSWYGIPNALINNEELLAARKRGVLRVLKANPNLSWVPDYLQQDPDVLRVSREAWIEILKEDPSIWNYFPDEHKDELTYNLMRSLSDKSYDDDPSLIFDDALYDDREFDTNANSGFRLIKVSQCRSFRLIKVSQSLIDLFIKRWNDQGINIHVYEGDNYIKLNQIVVPKEIRKQGIGSAIMRELIDISNKLGKRILLTPDTSYGGSSINRLRRFYQQFGFVNNKGRNKDYSTTEGMYREPDEVL